MEPHIRAGQSERTHIICARCGQDNPANNSMPADGTLTFDGRVVMLNCRCGSSYPLPVKFIKESQDVKSFVDRVAQ